MANAAKIEEESKAKIQTTFDNTLKSIQETFNKAYNPQTPSQPQTVNVNWTISGDPNITKNINQDQFDRMLNTSTSNPDTRINVTNNLVNKNAPSATTGGKNQ